jgi:acyl-CoA synthetase (AMP-forming)/AMP-acid ligase II
VPQDLHEGRRTVGGRSIRWDKARTAEAYGRGLWVSTTLADALVDAAARTPDRVVLIDGDRRLDCRGLLDEASTLAHALVTRMPVGSVVSFMLPNWSEAAVIYAAATMAGMVVNPILPSLRDSELRFILDDVESRMIFIPSEFRGHDYAAMLDRVVGELVTPPEVVVVREAAESHIAYSELFRDAPSGGGLPSLDPDAVRMILYTSGTTGRPKGVLHSHNSIHALICQIRDHWQVEPGDKFLVPSPIAHIGGSIYAFECPLLIGATAVLMDRWDAADAVTLMTAERCTHMAGATPFLEQLLTAAESAATRLPDLKVFICGGASVSPSLIHRAAAYFDGAAVTRVYGSTEVPVTTIGSFGDVDHAAQTDGRPGIADIWLAPHVAAPKGSGEICARGAQMLVGYLHPEDEGGSFDAEGYFHTGDLACRVDDDFLVVTGRAKDIVIRNGENISAKEIEDLLVGRLGIAEVAVVGVPDARTGERAVAVVVRSGAADLDVTDLRRELGAHGIAKFKVPEQVAIWDELPKNAAGKVLKHEIRTRLVGD